jgi:hypothetical protein
MTIGTDTAASAHSVVSLNLMYLLALRDAAAKDPAQACYEFGLTREELEQLQSLGFDSVYAIAKAMDRCMVSLRVSVSDLRRLSTVPRPLAGIMASMRR